MGADYHKSDERWQGRNTYYAARAVDCALSSRQICHHDTELEPHSSLAAGRELVRGTLNRVDGLRGTNCFFAFHREENTIAIGVANNKTLRIAIIHIGQNLLCASTGALDAKKVFTVSSRPV